MRAGLKCGAKIRGKDKTCVQAAGFRTTHVGEGRCYFHGGATPIVKHGRYSTITHPGIRAALDAQNDELEDVMDLRPEVKLLRATITHFANDYEAMTSMLRAWNADPGCPRPAWVPDLHEVSRLAEKTARIADTVHRIQTEGSISLDSYRRLMNAMGEAVARQVNKMTCLGDEDKARLTQAIEDDWLSMAAK